MSIILEDAAENAGIEMDGNLPAKGHRLNKDFSKFIGEIRKVESKVVRKLDEARERAEKAYEALAQAQAENAELRMKVAAYEFEKRAKTLNLAEKDQRFLLTGSEEEAA